MFSSTHKLCLHFQTFFFELQDLRVNNMSLVGVPHPNFLEQVGVIKDSTASSHESLKKLSKC